MLRKYFATVRGSNFDISDHTIFSQSQWCDNSFKWKFSLYSKITFVHKNSLNIGHTQRISFHNEFGFNNYYYYGHVTVLGISKTVYIYEDTPLHSVMHQQHLMVVHPPSEFSAPPVTQLWWCNHFHCVTQQQHSLKVHSSSNFLPPSIQSSGAFNMAVWCTSKQNSLVVLSTSQWALVIEKMFCWDWDIQLLNHQMISKQ